LAFLVLPVGLPHWFFYALSFSGFNRDSRKLLLSEALAISFQQTLALHGNALYGEKNPENQDRGKNQ